MSFTYKNISTDSLLDVPLRIGVTEGIEKYEGFSREIMKGESSISRPILTNMEPLMITCQF